MTPLIFGLIAAGIGSAVYTYLSKPSDPEPPVPATPDPHQVPVTVSANPLNVDLLPGDVVRVPFNQIPDETVRAKLITMTPVATDKLIVGFAVTAANPVNVTGQASTWATFSVGDYTNGPVAVIPRSRILDVYRHGTKIA